MLVVIALVAFFTVLIISATVENLAKNRRFVEKHKGKVKTLKKLSFILLFIITVFFLIAVIMSASINSPINYIKKSSTKTIDIKMNITSVCYSTGYLEYYIWVKDSNEGYIQQAYDNNSIHFYEDNCNPRLVETDTTDTPEIMNKTIAFWFDPSESSMLSISENTYTSYVVYVPKGTIESIETKPSQ